MYVRESSYISPESQVEANPQHRRARRLPAPPPRVPVHPIFHHLPQDMKPFRETQPPDGFGHCTPNIEVPPWTRMRVPITCHLAQESQVIVCPDVPNRLRGSFANVWMPAFANMRSRGKFALVASDAMHAMVSSASLRNPENGPLSSSATTQRLHASRSVMQYVRTRRPLLCCACFAVARERPRRSSLFNADSQYQPGADHLAGR